ncbi:unnamed protein product [Schistosoma curassoni]|uniref:Uncharacterized protein n=1 Tax=Schistosoma curassoni TaxID=6186 RepID=A0A183KV38_9TREM|nr:unnamed protein product [Schistosoma curassoni]
MRYNLAVCGVSKTHWTQAGRKSLDTGEMLLSSGHEEKMPHTIRVAPRLSKESRNAFIEWESHGARTIKAFFKKKRRNHNKCYSEETTTENSSKGIREALTSTCQVPGCKKDHTE